MSLLIKELDRCNSEAGRREAFFAGCKAQNKLILDHSSELVAEPGRQSLSTLVKSIAEGSVCANRNEFTTDMVRSLTLTGKEKSGEGCTSTAEIATQKRREMHKLMAVEQTVCLSLI